MVVSITSLWEMQIKVQLAKLHLSLAVEDIVRVQQHENDVELLSIGLSEVVRLRQLPLHHRDPFDRMLIAQALVEKVPIITVDPVFAHYPVQTIW
jgi:PIN domain nuclease of toxin-antitoxin system